MFIKENLIFLLTAAVFILSLSLPVSAETVKPYGEPWLTCIVDGMVTADLEKPELKDDFFLYNNYEWLRDTVLKPGSIQDGGLVGLSDLVDEQIDSLFTDESITGPEAELVREYYQMFLDWESRAEGWEFFLKHLKPIRDIETLDDLTAYLTSEERLYYGPDLGGVSLSKNLLNPDEWMVEIRWTNLSMIDSGEYAEMTPAGANNAKYHDDQASYVLQYAGFSEDEAAEVVRQNREFEALLAPYIMTDQEQSEADGLKRMLNTRTREELAAASPNYPILDIMDRCDFNPELVINLDNPAWLEKLNELYTEENVPLMRAYLLYEKTFFTMQFLDEAAYRAYQKMDMAYEGADESESDERAAMGYTQTFLSQFVDKMYLKKYTSDKTREDIIGVMQGIIAAYREMLLEETWLTEETRDQAIKKLDTMALNAVRPDSWEDWSGYAFRSRAEGGNLMEATAELRRCQLELERKNSYGKPDPDIWPAGAASSVNARYNKQNNSINMYAGILQDDVYRDDMTREELLAGAGTIIAHEISHAFDIEGSQFDETGAFRDWWTDADHAAFDRRAGKLIAYYDSLRPWKDGSPYSGAMVQSEAIADLGGMACIMRIAEKTENFDYDAFFRAYAQLRRRKLTENAFENGFRTNPHPMDHLRVNVLIAQFPEFQETYDIQPGDGMYVAPGDRIGIWGMPENTAP